MYTLTVQHCNIYMWDPPYNTNTDFFFTEEYAILQSFQIA